jgi:hypothetical protein
MANESLASVSGRAALRALKQPIFDTMECPAAPGVNNLTFFQAPQGHALNVTGLLKNISDTNLSAAGQLADPQEADIFGYSATFMYDDSYFDDAGAAVATLANFAADSTLVYEGAVFRFFFGPNRQFLCVPMTRVPHGTFGLTGPGGVVIDDEKFFVIANGESTKDNFVRQTTAYELANGQQTKEGPITILPTETFSARIEYPLANLALSADGVQSRITVYLNGVLYAAV